MIQAIGLLLLHLICLYFLQLLWKDKNESLKRGFVMTKMGHVSKGKSPHLFYFSVWIDFLILLMLYVALVVYSIVLVSR